MVGPVGGSRIGWLSLSWRSRGLTVVPEQKMLRCVFAMATAAGAKKSDCIAFVALGGVEARPVIEALDAEIVDDPFETKCKVVTVLTTPGKRRAACDNDVDWRISRYLKSQKQHHRRELRFFDDRRFYAVGVVETVEATARLFDRKLPIRGSWIEVINATLALNKAVAEPVFGEEFESYMKARFEALSYLPRSTPRCPPSPHPGGYVWIHAYGYGPLEPIHAEGLNGWRIVFARALAMAKEVGASMILPCARHSILVPCGVPRGPLVQRDPLGNSADDDYVEPSIKANGVDPAVKDWLDIFFDDADSLDDPLYDDDASRGVPRRHRIDDVSAYFDMDRMTAFLGAPPISVRCAATFHDDVALTYVRATNASLDDVRIALANKSSSSSLRIAKFGGGFNLASLRDAVDRDKVKNVELSTLRVFASRLEREATDLRELLFGTRPYTAIHWRSETLIARKDPRAPAAFSACAEALFRTAPQNEPVLLVTDIPYDADVPSWVSLNTKLHRAHPAMATKLREFLQRADERNWHKLDALLTYRGPQSTIDLGDVAILEQILAVDADLLITHYDTHNDTLDKWRGVSFNDCGYAGRFMRTIVTRRTHQKRPVHNWYPPGGFPTLRVGPPPPRRRHNDLED